MRPKAQRQQHGTLCIMNLSSNPRRNEGGRLARFVSNPLFTRSAFLLVVIVFIWLFRAETELAESGALPHANSAWCLDEDDDPSYKPKVCDCPDPTKAYNPNDDIWSNQAERMKTASSTAPSDLDVVFLGDSITEHLNGTRGLGLIEIPENRAIFVNYFGKAEGAQLHGLALGSSGDTSHMLNWHIGNNRMIDPVDPKVFVVLIGTNDLGRFSCSKSSTLKGIITVLELLRTRKPQTPIVVHGLMPRSDLYREEPPDLELGRFWSEIQWINRHLQEFVEDKQQDEKGSGVPVTWYYMDTGNLFLRAKDGGEGMQIDGDLMDDALHPNVRGMQVWAKELVSKLVPIVNKI